MKYIKLFENHTQYETFIGGDMLKPNVSHCIEENEVHYNPIIDYSKMYLTFVSLEDNNEISFISSKNPKTISVSLDNGNTWIDYTSSTEGVVLSTLNNGQKMILKGNNNTYGSSYAIYNKFSSSKMFNVEGNIMSLINDNFSENTELTSGTDFTFNHLFDGCSHLISVENLSLPATTLTSRCYEYMFKNCTNLTVAPKLPSTTLVQGCYQGMFEGCTSLTTAPELPATTLGWYCYRDMFSGCISLTVAPALPATTLAQYCYQDMFEGCTSLTTAPELPATTLVNTCYSYMFNGCTNLNYIKAMFTTTPTESTTNDWVQNVASTGTFVKNSAATWTTTGVDGIPSGWTVETATE